MGRKGRKGTRTDVIRPGLNKKMSIRQKRIEKGKIASSNFEAKKVSMA